MIRVSDINSLLSSNHDRKNGNHYNNINNDHNYVRYDVRQITSIMKKKLLIQNQLHQLHYDHLYQQNCPHPNDDNVGPYWCSNNKQTLKIMACGWLYLILMIIIIKSNMIIEASALLSSPYSTLNYHHHRRDHQHSSSINHHFSQSNYVNKTNSSIGHHSG